MHKIPVCFAFDNKLIEAAGVCFASLLLNAYSDTFYDIYVLHSLTVTLDEVELRRAIAPFKNCSLTLIKVDNSFEDAYEIRHVTKATYYRLLIPEILPQFDKIIYSDVDIIFQNDLSEAFNIDLGDAYVAGVPDIGMNTFCTQYLNDVVKIPKWDYLQAGFLILNLKAMRADGLVSKFKAEATKNYTYQDQDIVNIICAGRKVMLPLYLNVNDCAYIQFYAYKPDLPIWMTEEQILRARRSGNMHYSGYKPWQRYSIAFDLWWEYYRRSAIFDERRYFKFFLDKTSLLDSLSLWKRIKGIARYFVYGRYKG